MSSIVRTIARALARQTVEAGDTKAPVKKPAPKRQRRKGGRSGDTYRAAGRFDAIKTAKAQRRLVREAEAARPAQSPKPWRWVRSAPRVDRKQHTFAEPIVVTIEAA